MADQSRHYAPSLDIDNMLGEPSSFMNDSTLGESQFIPRQSYNAMGRASPRNTHNRTFCQKIESFFFRRREGRGAASKNDHLKAAPCVSANFLACLRITIAIALLGQCVMTVLATNKINASFKFISMWNLFALTTLFTTLAVV